ncbi:unnamed protein product [Urochloa decumbens]|uniref:Expressed protein-RZ53 n=1 Tax=Urochloa decumbens TaxID=240449 RepID=A0ABC9AUL0_9POAL
MVLGLGGCCGGVAVADGRASPAAKQDPEKGDPEAKKQQRRVVKEKMKGGELAEVAAEKERKKRERQKDPPIVVHQFPFYSRPGLL